MNQKYLVTYYLLSEILNEVPIVSIVQMGVLLC